MKFPLCLITAFWAASSLTAQSVDSPQPAYPFPTHMLRFDDPKPANLGKGSRITVAEFTCAPDGAVFLQLPDSPTDYEMILHSLKGPTENVRFDTKDVSGYHYVTLQHYFVNERRVAILASAVPVPHSLEKTPKQPKPVQIILLYDRKGKLEDTFQLPADINAKAIGIYGSGDLLVVDVNEDTKAARFIVMDNKGNQKNEFLLFDSDYNSSPGVKKDRVVKALGANGVFLSMQMAPFGDNLLIFPRFTAEPVLEVNEGGVVHSVKLQVPSGYSLDSFFSLTPTSWEIHTNLPAIINTDPNTSQATAGFHPGPVLNFNAVDGSVIEEIRMPKRPNGILVCDHNGTYTAFGTAHLTGEITLLTGHVDESLPPQ